jgi:hypothetical protein
MIRAMSGALKKARVSRGLSPFGTGALMAYIISSRQSAAGPDDLPGTVKRLLLLHS